MPDVRQIARRWFAMGMLPRLEVGPLGKRLVGYCCWVKPWNRATQAAFSERLLCSPLWSSFETPARRAFCGGVLVRAPVVVRGKSVMPVYSPDCPQASQRAGPSFLLFPSTIGAPHDRQEA